jgi:hypothetical protein
MKFASSRHNFTSYDIYAWSLAIWMPLGKDGCLRIATYITPSTCLWMPSTQNQNLWYFYSTKLLSWNKLQYVGVEIPFSLLQWVPCIFSNKYTNCGTFHIQSWSCALNMPFYLNAICFHNLLWFKWNSFNNGCQVCNRLALRRWWRHNILWWRVKRHWCMITRDKHYLYHYNMDF